MIIQRGIAAGLPAKPLPAAVWCTPSQQLAPPILICDQANGTAGGVLPLLDSPGRIYPGILYFARQTLLQKSEAKGRICAPPPRTHRLAVPR